MNNYPQATTFPSAEATVTLHSQVEESFATLPESVINENSLITDDLNLPNANNELNQQGINQTEDLKFSATATLSSTSAIIPIPMEISQSDSQATSRSDNIGATDSISAVSQSTTTTNNNFTEIFPPQYQLSQQQNTLAAETADSNNNNNNNNDDDDDDDDVPLSSAAETNCYHCGLELPAGLNLTVEILGEARKMCCLGCQAVAKCIVENGLIDYYHSRESLPASPRNLIPKELEHLKLYDNAEFQQSFVRTIGENQREGTLLFEGITCAACTWLIEQHLSKVAGIASVQMNYVSKKAKICWDESKIKLSNVLEAVEKIGYQAHPYDIKRRDLLADEERRSAIWRIWVAGFSMMQVMMYAFPSYMTQEGELSPSTRTIFNWAGLLLTIPVVFYSAQQFFTNSWRDIKNKQLGMDVPVALGVATTFIWSVVATITQSGSVYFDSIAMFVFFLLGGRYLEMLARQKALNINESLARLQPDFATRIVAPAELKNSDSSDINSLVVDEIYPENFQFTPDKISPGEENKVVSEVVAISKLSVGDKLLVKPGEIIPVDGTIVSGVSSIDESLLTGESTAVPKQIGDQVISGSVNVGQAIEVQVNQLGDATRLSAILRLMDRAASEKPMMVQYADRLAAYFIAAVLLIALMVGGIWLILAPQKALIIVVAVLIVTCPCALSLATPIALTVAQGVLARKSVLITRANTIEGLATIDQVVFDKTGTLTNGKFSLLASKVHRADFTTEQALQLATSLEAKSEHLLARAFAQANLDKLANLTFTNFTNHPGQGVSGEYNGNTYRIGNLIFIQAMLTSEIQLDILDRDEAISGNEVYLADQNGLIAHFIFGDSIRREAKEFVKYLQQHNIATAIFSGDTQDICDQVAGELGIRHVQAQLLPEEKYQKLCKLQADGKTVAMIGDGINDAPILAKAQVSIAMGGGTHLAQTQADLILLNDDLDSLRSAIEISKFTMYIIRQNMMWALFYNIIALPIAIIGMLSPGWAGIGMAGSSLIVVINSLRINSDSRDIFTFIRNSLFPNEKMASAQAANSHNTNSLIKASAP